MRFKLYGMCKPQYAYRFSFFFFNQRIILTHLWLCFEIVFIYLKYNKSKYTWNFAFAFTISVLFLPAIFKHYNGLKTGNWRKIKSSMCQDKYVFIIISSYTASPKFSSFIFFHQLGVNVDVLSFFNVNESTVWGIVIFLGSCQRNSIWKIEKKKMKQLHFVIVKRQSIRKLGSQSD